MSETQASNLNPGIPIMPNERLFPSDTPKHLFNAPPPAVYPQTDLPEPPVIDRPNANGFSRPGGEACLEGMEFPDNSIIAPPAEGKARILIGVPILAVTFEFFESFLKFWTRLCITPHPNYEVGYQFIYRKPVHMAEETLVKAARFNKSTHILLMDDDIYDVTTEDLEKLLAADKDCISGVMHASKFPHAMCVFRRFDLNKKVIDMPADNSMYRLYEVPCQCPKCNAPQTHWDVPYCPMCGEKLNLIIQQADLTPFPFTLIKMSVFDKIKKPWFHCTNEYPTDSWFADRLIEAGMTMHAHMGVRLNHAGITDETKPHFAQIGMIRSKQTNAVVQITPEQMELHQNMLVNKMRETEESLKQKGEFISEAKTVAGEAPKKATTIVTHGR